MARKLRQDSIEKEKKDNDYSQIPAADPEEETVGKYVPQILVNPAANEQHFYSSLLNFEDEPEGSLKKFLFGRESPVEEKNQEPEDERPESPLGVPENECDAERVERDQQNKVRLGQDDETELLGKGNLYLMHFYANACVSPCSGLHGECVLACPHL